ncbi:Glyoxylase, beta-lactamase superfamily II [Maridesulfovibrio ferrireducens]|uniref:Glyoxylase, beta-lactamase superfamily II n=1 Tax=Maridesulfovibrio ferrireducens TaxID=246191 RepID=A0A1G9FYQ4_9BACT|nr:MBL fold metallo-hydrolase [Maridesulfovibrio ferrireducens]SDK93518.1 Glyoxylase, beta-lactamase superfamily II [Maridesulfovibrio ferrireducens]
MDIKVFPLGPLETNCYVITNDNKAVVIDPGGDPTSLLNFFKKTGVELDCILNTHLHFDHIIGNAALVEATGKTIYAAESGLSLMETGLGDGSMIGVKVAPFESEHIKIGKTQIIGLECNVLSTPGHAPGSLTFYFPALETAFVGDLIFQRSIGRTDFPGGDLELLKKSVQENIFTLPEKTTLLSGHGPATSVGDEINHNPFFSSMQF